MRNVEAILNEPLVKSLRKSYLDNLKMGNWSYGCPAPSYITVIRQKI